MEMIRMHYKECSSRVFLLFFGIMMMSLYSGCISEVVEPEPYPKRNILFYIGGDNDLLGETYQKIDQIRAGWDPGKGEMIIYVDQKDKGAVLLRVNETKNAGGYSG
ncbi:MAG: hypothetical protein LBS79_03670, partial [Tannerella sp.]|nr:hypothetical protein [Tannerella sp.]